MSIFASPLFFRLFVGLFLSIMVAWSYRRSRRCERGAPVSMAFLDAPAGHKFTYVYFDPLTLPMVLGIYLPYPAYWPWQFWDPDRVFSGSDTDNKHIFRSAAFAPAFSEALLLLPRLRRFVAAAHFSFLFTQRTG